MDHGGSAHCVAPAEQAVFCTALHFLNMEPTRTPAAMLISARARGHACGCCCGLRRATAAPVSCFMYAFMLLAALECFLTWVWSQVVFSGLLCCCRGCCTAGVQGVSVGLPRNVRAACWNDLHRFAAYGFVLLLNRINVEAPGWPPALIPCGAGPAAACLQMRE